MISGVHGGGVGLGEGCGHGGATGIGLGISGSPILVFPLLIIIFTLMGQMFTNSELVRSRRGERQLLSETDVDSTLRHQLDICGCFCQFVRG